jgi:FdhD protein
MTAHAVMMATPEDLADFALGFSLTEGIVASLDEIERLDIIEEEVGIELRMWLAEPRAAGLRTRRRHLEVPQSVSFLRARCCQRLQPEESGR